MECADEAAERVREAYQNRGYFEAEVNAAILPVPRGRQGDRLEIAVKVLKSGKRYRLHEIHWIHATAFSEQQLSALMPISPGEVLGRAKIVNGLENVREIYESRGYINFTCIPTPQVDEEHGTISLEMDVDEGGKFVLAGAVFSGLTSEQTYEAVEILAPLNGQTFSKTLIAEASRQLRSVIPPCANLGNQGLKADAHAHTVYLFYDFEECADQWLNSRFEYPENQGYEH